MAYKVYISTSSNEICARQLGIIKRALYSMNEFPLAAIDMLDLMQSGSDHLEAAQQMISQSDLFIGLYSSDYGQIPTGETASYPELEYLYARDQGKACLIFTLKNTYAQAEPRQKAFLSHLMQHHVLITFHDDDDLAAQVKLSIDKYKQSKQNGHRNETIQAQAGGFIGSSYQNTEAPHNDFEAQVNRAINLAQDEIEQIVRRSLELHDAQKQIHQQKNESMHYTEDTRDGLILAQPLWGEPLRRSQFQSDIFMIMPFRERYDAVYNEVIRPVTAELNLSIKRGDDFSSTQGSIMQEVWAAIHGCRLVIAETTANNPNVYYELGIAHMLGKPAILLTQMQHVDQIPFDIRHLRFLIYDEAAPDYSKLTVDLRRSIVWILNDLQEQLGE